MLGRFSLLEREARRGPSVGDEISAGGECAYFFWRGGTHVSVRELSAGERGRGVRKFWSAALGPPCQWQY
jgi:hypothetical protein